MKVKVFEKMQGSTPMYETVFDGSVSPPAEQTVQSWFTRDAPPECQRKRLSEPVVCVCETEDGERKTYVSVTADRMEKLNHFSENAVIPMRGHRMLVVEPGQPPREAVVADDLRSLQKVVGGYIEVVYPFDDNVLIIDNEEGKLIGLEGNRRLGEDILAGTFLLAGDDGEGGFKDLTNEQVRQYGEMFARCENFSPEEINETIGFCLMD